MVVSANEVGRSYKTIATKKTKMKTFINLQSKVREDFQHHSYSDQRPAKNQYKDGLYNASRGLQTFHEKLSNPHTAFKTLHFKSIRASVANNVIQFAILCA